MPDHPSHGTTSASLLVRVRNPADQTTWREFEARYAELIRRYCRGRGLRAADIDDVSQMVWGDLAKGLRAFAYDPAKGRFRGYLGKTVRSVLSRHFRRNGMSPQALNSSVLASAPDESDGADERWDREWVDHHYRLAMETIAHSFEEQSVTAFRRLIAGEPTHLVASDLGVSVAAVNQAKHRIRVRMKELIAAQIREEDEPDSPPER